MDLTKLPDQLSEIDDELKDLSELVPYAKHILKAYKWAKKRRMIHFLKTLNQEIHSWDEKQKDKFKKHIQSDEGAGLLSEYSDTVLNTSSLIGISALALLYGDIESKIYDPAFKLKACYAIEGASDEIIGIFLLLLSLPIRTRKEQPYNMHFIEEKDINDSHELSELVGQPENIFGIVHDLIRRGMLLPDHTPNRISNETWRCIYGSAATSQNFKNLFVRAKEAIKK
jgi:hypothetical protein